jgi:ABC-type cobalamin transport system ATPase subunit
MTRDGYDRAMNYIGIWLTLKSVNRRLYKHLESEAEIGGQEWRARVDALVETVSRDLAPMGRLIAREPQNGSIDANDSQLLQALRGGARTRR